MQQRFVHLRLHTEYSLIDGLVQIDPLIQALPSRGMCAVAVTDYCNLFAAVKQFTSAVQKGIKPIIGSDIPWHHLEKPEQTSSIILLCLNNTGYKHLTRLISKAYQEGQFQGQPLVQHQWFKDHAEGLIALSGGKSGDIGQALLNNDKKAAKERALYWQSLFPNRFYLEIQRSAREDESLYNQLIIELSDELSLPLVATNDVCFLNKDDFEAHEARVCIHDGITLAEPKRKHYSPEQYLKSADEMLTLFRDLPSALENTVEISRRCTVILELGKYYLPNFPIPKGQTVDAYLSQLSEKGLHDRLKQLKKEDDLRYEARLQTELQVINQMGFAGYFLIVADFIQWAKQNEVPVGPGRGSGAGSLVAYVLKITDLDPLEYDLLFERFLNPERVSMPDFDIDFCMEGRDRVIEYVADKYGRNAVSQIITFGTMAAKAVVRDVGRVLGLPYPFVDKLAKLIPFELGMTLNKALEQEEELRRRFEEEDEVRALFKLALKLEGITKNAGKHAGGVVIAPNLLTEFTAIYCEQGSTQIVSQFDKDDVEAVGLIKFDFLGLRTLTIIDWALKAIQQQSTQLIDISQIPTDDLASFDLLKKCQTTAVFQLESRGMKELIKRLQPDCFEDIIALVALFRPGPLQSGMVDDFIDRKHKRAAVEYLHPDLEPILKPTYGVILYQEQVMQIAQVLANYTLGAADLLRRAMGKKKPEEMAKQREIFLQGAKNRGVDEAKASQIFDLMEKFAGYGFNKSHSAAYALIAYQTAWLKAHYPAAFMAAVLSSDMDNTDKVVNFIDDCVKMQLRLLPPSINQSFYRFTVHDETSIQYGLGAIKGAGEAAIDCIIKERQKGPFSDLFNFCQRLDLRKVNRRVLEALIKGGAFDEWQERAIIEASLEKALKMAEKIQANQSSGQLDLFSMLEDQQAVEYLDAPPWSDIQRLEGEKEVLGYYLTGHPVESYQLELKDFITPITSLDPSRHKKAIICAQVLGIRKIMTKSGKKLVILQMEDATEKMDVVVFDQIFDTYTEPLSAGSLLLIEGEVAVDTYNGGLKLTATQLYSIASARSKFARFLEIQLSQQNQGELKHVQSLLRAHPGTALVRLTYHNEQAKGSLSVAPTFSVNPCDELISSLNHLLGKSKTLMHY